MKSSRTPNGPASLDRLRRELEVRARPWPEIAKLAEETGLSVFAVSRLFQRHHGKTPRAYLRDRRLDDAAIFLGRTDLDTLSIALCIGYHSQQSFTRAFVSRFGVPPVQYRRNFWSEHGKPGAAGRRPAPVQPVDLPSMRLLARRYLGDYADVPAHWHDFGQAVERAGIDASQHQIVGLTYDDPAITPPGHNRYDCAVVLADSPAKRSTRLRGETIALPGGMFAALRHEGRYAREIEKTYAAIVLDWLPASGWTMDARPGLELFHRPPWTTGQAAWTFTVHVPITSTAP